MKDIILRAFRSSPNSQKVKLYMIMSGVNFENFYLVDKTPKIITKKHNKAVILHITNGKGNRIEPGEKLFYVKTEVNITCDFRVYWFNDDVELDQKAIKRFEDHLDLNALDDRTPIEEICDMYKLIDKPDRQPRQGGNGGVVGI